MERPGVHPGRAHRRGLHALHRGHGREEEHPAAAALRAPAHVLRRRRAHDLPRLRRPRVRD
ncbi:hypothetical protein CRUP_027185, partial [Coryphaenoides rupestris]